MCEMVGQFIQKKQEEKWIEKEQAIKAQNSKIPICYDDDDDEERSNSLKDNIISRHPQCFAITPNEPADSLSMGDEHLDTVPEIESDEFIKSCVENLVPNPSESEGENGCDVPACFTTFSNVLFDADYEFNSVDDQSLSDEDFSKEIYSNPLFEVEIIPIKIDQHHFNTESDLIESLLNHDSSIIPSSSKIDSLLDDFADICLIERLLYDNSSPRPPKEFVFENSNADIEYFSPSPIPIKDSDSLMEEIDLSCTPNDPMPPGIKEDDYDSERDIIILEELLDNYSLSLPVIESYHFDIPSFSRPLAKPPDAPPKWLAAEYESGACYFEDQQHKIYIEREEISSGSTTTHSDISLLDYEAFYFDDDHIEEISSGSTTTHSDISLLDYEAFYFDDDHIEEISSGSTTTHSYVSLFEYDSFIFDLANDQFAPTDMSNFANEEFADELAHIIPEYDCFYFRNLPDPGELMSILNSGIRENLSSTTCVNLPIEDDHSPLLAYVVWIFLAYLTYPVIPPYLHPFGNEDTIFNPGITINHFYSFKPGLSHRCGAFKKFNTHRSHLNEWPMIINGKNTHILDVLLFHFYPP
nr:hypothetical protein [Tanacetum cinerariifolium]